MRVKLSNELVEVINEFGPQLYEDFNEVRPTISRSLFATPLTSDLVPDYGPVFKRTTVFWSARSVA